MELKWLSHRNMNAFLSFFQAIHPFNYYFLVSALTNQNTMSKADIKQSVCVRGLPSLAHLSYNTEQKDDHQQQDAAACCEVLEVNAAAHVSLHPSLLCHGMNGFSLRNSDVIVNISVPPHKPFQSKK